MTLVRPLRPVAVAGGADTLQQDEVPVDAAPLNGGEPFRGYDGNVGAREEFWVLDVDGTRVVIVAFSLPATPEVEITQMRAIIDLIRIDR